ncbi:hypothetical protein HW115_19125 [Verrucomicrobiaceae bacterium N1E253]|uniref:Uncharacterized protein n=1 Tax=Oceaniferula marina TaxID=2748318 RepID=A0A851GKS4_9BACT|nr:hypothetical protein [Oceaniferula marina]NWK57739.1 hypothetical protein [Oceaniferula marina]
MHRHLISLFSLFILASSLSAHEVELLHLVTRTSSELTSKKTKVEKAPFGLMAEIEGAVNFSLRGEFKSAKIIEASTVAPDGNKYNLEAMPDGPPSFHGELLSFLKIKHGERRNDFSIGSWKVTVKFEVDGEVYMYVANYLISWRKPESKWGMQQWVNQKNVEQVVAPDR